MSKFIPNSFQIANSVVDEILPQLSDAALRCYLVIVRQTTGWNKESDQISITQFQKKTGKSKNTVIKGCEELVSIGLIKKKEGSKEDRIAAEFSLNIPSSKSELGGFKICTRASSKSELGLVQNLNIQSNTKTKYHYNKRKEEKINKKEETDFFTNDKNGTSPLAVMTVFNHWKTRCNHSKAQLDNNRKKQIANALKMGYSVGDLQQAIDGLVLTPHNMGENDRGQVYDGLHIVFKDADNIDRFMRNAVNPPKALNKQESIEAKNMKVLQEYRARKAAEEAQHAS